MVRVTHELKLIQINFLIFCIEKIVIFFELLEHVFQVVTKFDLS